MERQGNESDGRGRDALSGRKPYTSPELQGWGSIQDLTQGILQGKQDFPIKGGSRPA